MDSCHTISSHQHFKQFKLDLTFVCLFVFFSLSFNSSTSFTHFNFFLCSCLIWQQRDIKQWTFWPVFSILTRVQVQVPRAYLHTKEETKLRVARVRSNPSVWEFGFADKGKQWNNPDPPFLFPGADLHCLFHTGDTGDTELGCPDKNGLTGAADDITRLSAVTRHPRRATMSITTQLDINHIDEGCEDVSAVTEQRIYCYL